MSELLAILGYRSRETRKNQFGGSGQGKQPWGVGRFALLMESNDYIPICIKVGKGLFIFMDSTDHQHHI